MTAAAISSGRVAESDPFGALPTAVRTADTITAEFIFDSSNEKHGDVARCPHFQYGLKLKMGTQGDVPIFPGTAFLCVFVFPCHTSVPQHFPLLQQMLPACQGLRLSAKGFERLTLQIQEI